MARFVTSLIVGGTLYGLFGPVGLLAAIAAWAALRLARRVLLPVILLAGVLLLAAIAGGAIEGGDIGPAVPYRLSGFRWPEEQLPIGVDLGLLRPIDGIPAAAARRAARRAMAGWNRAAGRALLVEGPGPVRVVVDGCDPGAAGQARIRLDRQDGAPLRAEVCVNDERATFSLTGEPGTFDLETILLHEFGHVLGLDHPVRYVPKDLRNDVALCSWGQPDRVMCPRPRGVVTREPLPGDIAGIQALY